MKMRKKPTDHRQGNLVRLVDAFHKMTELAYSKDLFKPDAPNDYMSYEYNPEVVDKIRDILLEIWKFDITEIGNLYLTSGGRITLDHGYGEHFNETDTVLFTKEQLKTGIRPKEFIKRIVEVLEERK